MTRFFCAAVAVAVIGVLAGAARGQDDKDPMAVIDKSIKALGGEEKLSKAKAIQIKAKVKFRFGENESEGTLESTFSPMGARRVFEGDFGGNQFRAVTVVAGEKGWRRFGDNAMELDADGLAAEKRRTYLSVVPMAMLPLKEKGLKVALEKEQDVGGKPANVLKVAGPAGKELTLSVDKQSGLPVKLVADVVGFGGEEFTQETTFADYKEVDGIKVAMKVESKRDGETFQEMTVTEFKVLDKVDPKTFAEPE